VDIDSGVNNGTTNLIDVHDSSPLRRVNDR
jgi:hypothetical protein